MDYYGTYIIEEGKRYQVDRSGNAEASIIQWEAKNAYFLDSGTTTSTKPQPTIVPFAGNGSIKLYYYTGGYQKIIETPMRNFRTKSELKLDGKYGWSMEDLTMRYGFAVRSPVKVYSDVNIIARVKTRYLNYNGNEVIPPFFSNLHLKIEKGTLNTKLISEKKGTNEAITLSNGTQVFAKVWEEIEEIFITNPEFPFPLPIESVEDEVYIYKVGTLDTSNPY